MGKSLKPLLNILGYQLVALSLTPFEGHDPNKPHTAQVTTRFWVARSEQEPQRFSVYMECRFFADQPHHNLPYVTQIGLLGEFFSLLVLEPNIMPARVVNNALMLLYGVARGVIGQITSNGINGSFVLPSVTFDDLILQATADPTTTVSVDEWLLSVQEADSKEENRTPEKGRVAPLAHD